MKNVRTLFAAASLAIAANATANAVDVSVPMDYRLIRNVVVNQLFTGEGQSARVWHDGKQCSFVDLSNPQIAGIGGEVKIDNNVHARLGTKLGGKCMTLVEWKGILETFQKPTLDATGNVLSFPVTKTSAIDSQGQALNIGQLQDLLQQAAAPKLAALKIDLNESRDDIVKTLLPYVGADESEQLYDTVNSLRFSQVKADAKAIVVKLAMNAGNLKKADKAAVEPLNDTEMNQWRQLWQDWRQSLDQSIERAPLPSEAADQKDVLRDVLSDADSAFEQGLSGRFDGNSDPVRVFLNQSWDKLGPLLRSASKQLPGAEGLRYLTLIAATDLIYELESIGSPLGLDISSNGLRKIARSYLKHKQGAG